MAAQRLIVVMGVSAAGKSSVGRVLADELGLEFVDADDLHPPANVAKMSAGAPLDDVDRWPWLDAVAARMAASPHGVVVACSALRRSYRDRLRAGAPRAVFVHLTGTSELLAERAAARTGHFMPPALLASQLATLEPLGDDELGIEVSVDGSVASIATAAAAWTRS